MKALSYTRWITTEIFFTLSIFSAVLFGTYALSIQSTNALSDGNLSILSGVFFVIFALSQLSSGMLINKISPKLLLSVSALISGIGGLIFANTSNYEILLLARFLLGLGLGCTFVGVLYVVQISFKEKQFAFFSSLSQSIGNIAAGSLALFAGKTLSHYSYSCVFDVIGILFILCSVALALVLPHQNTQTSTNKTNSISESFYKIIKSKSFWLATLYFTGLFGAILTYADLFNVTYQVQAFHVKHSTAIMMNGMIPIGVAAGGILAGYLVSKFQKNRLVAAIFGFLTLVSFIFMTYLKYPTDLNIEICFVVSILFGIGCGGAMLAFQEIQMNFSDLTTKSLANSMVLTFAYLFNGLIIQPVTGYIIGQTNTLKEYKQYEPYLSWLYDTSIHDTWHKYNNGLIVIVAILSISFLASLFFSKKKA